MAFSTICAALAAGWAWWAWLGGQRYDQMAVLGAVLFMLLFVCMAFVMNEVLGGHEVPKPSRHQQWELGVVGAQFPGKRITVLSTGNWLLTDIASGRTHCELTPNERETILKMRSPENTNQSKS